MFPLGSVLFPHMPLRLRVFEERYLVMLAELLKTDSARFGVVLIGRGPEVGGGEQRFGVGTVAEITQIGAQEGFVGLVAHGLRAGGGGEGEDGGGAEGGERPDAGGRPYADGRPGEGGPGGGGAVHGAAQVSKARARTHGAAPPRAAPTGRPAAARTSSSVDGVASSR